MSDSSLIGFIMSPNSMLLGYLTMFLGFLLGGIFYYVFTSLGLYKMAQNSQLENPWLAWLPFGNIYIIGSIVNEIDFLGQHITNLGIIFLLCPFIVVIASGILSIIPILGWLASFVLNILFLIFGVLVLFRMFKGFVGESATLYTILTLIVPFGAPICFMKAGNRPRL